MTILKKIIDHKQLEVQGRKELFPVKLLEQSVFFDTPTVSLRQYLMREDKTGIIAEIKRKSPSEGDINPYINVEHLSIGYMQAGASALSVLTDSEFFGGANSDLETARKFNFCPILRKDFVIDEYQVIEARSIGADAILLIASAIDPATAQKLGALANTLGLEVILEVHSADELNSHMHDNVQIVGVNNRNLSDFTVSIQTSIDIGPLIPEGVVKISESGISDASTIVQLKAHGFEGFLIGSHFMRQPHPQIACSDLIQDVKNRLVSNLT